MFFILSGGTHGWESLDVNSSDTVVAIVVSEKLVFASFTSKHVVTA